MAEYRRGRGPHFAQVPFELLDDPEANAYVIATYVAVKSYADFGSTDGAEVGDPRASKRAGCSERKFRECREWLRQRGWIEWEQVPTKTGRINRYVVHNSPAPVDEEAGEVRHTMPDPSGTPCRTHPAPGAGPVRHTVPPTNSHIPRDIATTTTPLNPPVESQPAEGDAASAAPAADPERTAPTGELTDDPAPPTPAPLAAEVEAAISQVIMAANRAMIAHPDIDQVRLRPIPTTGAGRQAVSDWIAEGIPIPLILEVIREAVREYEPGGHRTQISSMSYFTARIREANELRLAREAGSNEQHSDRGHQDDGSGVQRTRRASAGGAARRPGSDRRKQFVYG